MCNVFSQEFIREMNYRASLIERVEALRKSDNREYSKLIEKHRVEHGRLYILPIERLKELVSEITI